MRLIRQAIQVLRGGVSRGRETGFVVYRSPGCTCSDAAIALLCEEGVEPVVRELEDYPDIRREHGAGTPIVFVDGRLRFFGRVDRVPLLRLLENQRKASKQTGKP